MGGCRNQTKPNVTKGNQRKPEERSIKNKNKNRNENKNRNRNKSTNPPCIPPGGRAAGRPEQDFAFCRMAFVWGYGGRCVNVKRRREQAP